MQISKDLAQELTGIYNLLSGITTSGDNTLKMAVCLSKFRNIFSSMAIMDQTDDDHTERDDSSCL